MGDERLNQACTHGRGDNVDVAEPPEDPTVDTNCGATGCTRSGAAAGSTTRVNTGWRSCKFCPASFCGKHLAAHLTTNEALGPEHRMTLDEAGGPRQFVCRACSSKVEEIQHTPTGCATCEEVTNFQIDLRACCDAALGVASEALKADIQARADAICMNIEQFQGHMTRVRNQVLRWCPCTPLAYWCTRIPIRTHTPGAVLARFAKTNEGRQRVRPLRHKIWWVSFRCMSRN